jgi:FkbM family methyltransferase
MSTGYYDTRYRFLEFGATFVARVFDGYTYTVRDGLNKGMKRKGGLGFLPRLPWAKDTAEVSFLRSLPLAGKVVYDVGAFIGRMSLYFSKEAKQVVAFEPVNFLRLRENLQLNRVRNVTVCQFALGSREETRELVYDRRMPGAASGNDEIRAQILETSERFRTISIRIVPLDSLHDLPTPNLIKIDVEGMELEVLGGMQGLLKSARPDLYIELHGANVEQKEGNARAVVRFLKNSGYSRILHVESGETVSSVTESSIPCKGHLFCSQAEQSWFHSGRA